MPMLSSIDHHNNNSNVVAFDQRRMSEPFPDQFSFNPTRLLHRNTSMGSLRDPFDSSNYWKLNPTDLDPVSPIQDYGPSPPGTATSTNSSSANPPLDDHSAINNNSSNKTYSFVALPGNAVKKRPRRRYDEIERLYQCSWPDCNKAYGTLNHLNAHVTMQKHGLKRSPNEFKELRKQWRKAKKEDSSPGPIRRPSLVSMRHDGRDFSTCRYTSTEPVIYQPRQPSYPSPTVLSSSVPSTLFESDDKMLYPLDNSCYPLDDRDDLSIYGNHHRQRYNNNSPNSWHGSNRTSYHHQQQQYLSSSLPSHSNTHSSFAQGHGHNHATNVSTNLPPLDTHLNMGIQHHSSTTRSQPSPHSVPPPSNRLPPDSTLLTPLPGYQPPSLLPHLQIQDSLGYTAEPGYELYHHHDGHDGRPLTGHGSIISRGSEEEY